MFHPYLLAKKSIQKSSFVRVDRVEVHAERLEARSGFEAGRTGEYSQERVYR